MSLRTRLTIIYGGLLAVLFVGMGLATSMIVQNNLLDQLQSSLKSCTVQIRGSADQFDAKNPVLAAVITNGCQWEVYPRLKVRGKRVINPSPNLVDPAGLPASERLALLAIKDHPSFQIVSHWHGGDIELYYAPDTLPHGSGSALIVAKSISGTRHTIQTINAALLIGGAILWLAILVITWSVGQAVLRPIKRLTDQAASIAKSKDFSDRVPVEFGATELRVLTATFNTMLESLEEAHDSQRRFLADVSHELRTPLTVVQGNLHYLEAASDAPPNERDDALHAARLESDRMGSLVADLLALSHADAVQSLRHEPVELDRVIVDAYGRIMSRDRDVPDAERVHLHLGRLDECSIVGDYDRMLQLVMILLENSVKYTPAGGDATIELSVIPEHGARITVADTGIGIALEDREHIFDRFYRSKRARSMSDGSGLGLPIARWIAEAHDGSISFEPGPDGGTRFIVDLPEAVPGSLAGRRSPQVHEIASLL